MDGEGAERGYRPIADYAAVGDCHGLGLVARDGGIDWCTLGRFDAEPVFCRLLDRRKGGFLATAPSIPYAVERAYLSGTNILQTKFTTERGAALMTDFMPVGRSRAAGMHDYVSLSAPHALVRIVEGLHGRVPLAIAYRPSVNFAVRPAALAPSGGRISAVGGPVLQTDIGLTVTGDIASGGHELAPGERRCLIVSGNDGEVGPAAIERLLAVTKAFWEEWIRYCRYEGRHAEIVGRSALVLKLLTYAPSGAIVAAPTTSLPESIGGERNWDYRFCWLRDAALALHALATLGYSGEAERFMQFLHRGCAATHPDVQLMYGIGGESELAERPLDHLDGYAGSRPVRTGNDAFKQQQLDVYGYVLDAAHVYDVLGGIIDERGRTMLADLTEIAGERWVLPDQGLWETRSKPRHFVHSKAMCWTAVDRALRILGERGQWTSLRDGIAGEIRRQGRDGATGGFGQAYDGGIDAALLLLPMMGFEITPQELEATVARVERELRVGDLVHRYRTEDGLGGDEGAFLVCSFWLVDAKLALGRGAEARNLFEELIGRANDVGLLSEEIDIRSGNFLGNFPQALTHLGLIGSAINLELFESGGREAVLGTYADRARRRVRATFGWRGVLAALLSPGHRFRLLPSRRSKLPAKDE